MSTKFPLLWHQLECIVGGGRMISSLDDDNRFIRIRRVVAEAATDSQGNNNTIISGTHNINAMFCFVVIPSLVQGYKATRFINYLFMQQSRTNL